MMLVFVYVINRCTYLIRIQTDLGKAACAKRLAEKMFAKIQFIMVRLTNLNFMSGSEIPHLVLSDFNYVVLKSPKRLKQTVARSKLMKERPKINNRRGLMEFGILQHLEKCGERRNRCTTLISRKGSSLVQLVESELSGFYESQHLLKLKSDINNGLKTTNLSIIMSDPNFLIACWVRIKSNKDKLTTAFDETVDGIGESWFTEAAAKMRNGGYKFQGAKRKCIPKPNNNKLHSLTISSLKDKIVQEGMRFLLDAIFKSSFKDSSYGWRPNRGCLTALNEIRMKCKGSSWYVVSDLEQQFPTMNHQILVSIIKTKVDDQAFIDLLYKYMKIGYRENIKQATSIKIGVIQGGILSPILANIYMHPFDEWVENSLKLNFDKGEKRAKNPEYFKKYYQTGLKIKDKSTRSILSTEHSFKRMYYFRYADNFIIGVDGSKKDCMELKNRINDFLRTELNLVLNLDKTKIINARKESAHFLGYRIYKTVKGKMPVRSDKIGRMSQIVPQLILDGPIDKITKRLIEQKYANKARNPTRNAKFINYQLSDIINHYRVVERGILNYYSLANNYKNLAVRVHFILKYSCVLTIASKMKLKTKKKVFKKYGKDLSILNEKGKIIACYPTIKYKRPRKSLKSIKTFNINWQ
jgi:group II intron reverse transcriptase/maturase